MKYFQCSKCKVLKEVDESVHNTPALMTAQVACHDRRMRELTQEQYDHEVLQRAWITGGQTQGQEPSDTDLMNTLNIS